VCRPAKRFWIDKTAAPEPVRQFIFQDTESSTDLRGGHRVSRSVCSTLRVGTICAARISAALKPSATNAHAPGFESAVRRPHNIKRFAHALHRHLARKRAARVMTHIEVTAKNSRHVQIAVERHIEIENKRGFTARGRMLQRQARRVVFSSDALIRNCVLPYASCICIL